MIKYICQNCGARLESSSQLAGKQDKCPVCDNVQSVPEHSTDRTETGAMWFVSLAAICITAGAVYFLWPEIRDHVPQLGGLFSPTTQNSPVGDNGEEGESSGYRPPPAPEPADAPRSLPDISVRDDVDERLLALSRAGGGAPALSSSAMQQRGGPDALSFSRGSF